MAYHRQTRLEQAMLLRQSSLTYRSVYEPQPELPPPTAREARASIAETAKDRWNAEVESLARRTYEVDWNGVRSRAEDVVSSLWSKAFARAREEGEKRT
jgi:MICOS complex subunit MIC12